MSINKLRLSNIRVYKNQEYSAYLACLRTNHFFIIPYPFTACTSTIFDMVNSGLLLGVFGRSGSDDFCATTAQILLICMV